MMLLSLSVLIGSLSFGVLGTNSNSDSECAELWGTPIGICSIMQEDLFYNGSYSSGLFCSDNGTVIERSFDTSDCSGNAVDEWHYSWTDCNYDSSLDACNLYTYTIGDCSDDAYYTQTIALDLSCNAYSYFDNTTNDYYNESYKIQCDGTYKEYESSDCSGDAYDYDHDDLIDTSSNWYCPGNAGNSDDCTTDCWYWTSNIYDCSIIDSVSTDTPNGDTTTTTTTTAANDDRTTEITAGSQNASTIISFVIILLSILSLLQ